MNHKQYSDIQRCIGRLDGMGFALDEAFRGPYYTVLEELSDIIDDLEPEVGNEVKCLDEECSPTEDGLRMYVKYDGDPALPESKPVGYAYGEPWMQQALAMDDICFDTPGEARAAWEEADEAWQRIKFAMASYKEVPNEENE